MEKHWIRLWATFKGEFKPNHYLWPKGRRSYYKGYLGEIGHALKNIPVEYLRVLDIWNRGNKPKE